jgi:uncharacterized RDD family membrane protein YckC
MTAGMPPEPASSQIDSQAMGPTTSPASPAAYTLGWGEPSTKAIGPAPGYVYVGFWRRFGAGLIDAVVFWIVWIVLSFIVLIPAMTQINPATFAVDPATGRPVASPAELNAAFASFFGLAILLDGAIVVLFAAYSIVLWSFAGGTIGQRALGMQVRREADGRRISLGRAALRYIGYLVAWVPLALGIFWIGLDPRKQGWHDKIAGTFVIRRA